MMEQLNESWSNLVDKLSGWIDALILNLPNILLAAVVMSMAFIASKYIKKYIRKALNKTTINETVVSVASNVATAAFLIIMLFVVLGILNLDKALTSLLAGAGVVGLAIGLALQDPIVNLFSGIMMSVKDYYQVDDLIKTNGYFGKITKITLRSTVILQPDGQEVIISNKDVLQNPLVNFSHNGRRRIEVSCGVAYGDDLEEAKRIVLDCIENNVEIDDSKPVEVFFNEFGDSSINFVLRFWQNITSQGEYLSAQDKAIRAIKKAFDNNNITIPFPIRTLDFGVVGGERLDELYPLKKINNFESAVNSK